jgi:hypothetical protein
MAAILSDPAYVVPPPPPAGPVGTLSWLRATVSRFSAGADHARRRATIVARLATIDPAALRERARELAARHDPDSVPVIALAEALGARDPLAAAEAVATIAPFYNPAPAATTPSPAPTAPAPAATASPPAAGAAAATASLPPAADVAVAGLLDVLPATEPEVAAQDVAILVQACAATAALIAAGGALDPPPVPITRRIAPDGTLVEVDLTGRPFGDGPRACPGAEHALALAAGVLESRRFDSG